MAEGVEKDSPLKLDIVGCWPQDFHLKGQLSWNKVEICIEVKNEWPGLISQSSTYMQCMFKYQLWRLFVTVIHFNHKTMGVCFGFYGCKGLAAMLEVDISWQAGFERFVWGVVRIYSWTDPCCAGINTSCSNTKLIIPTWVYTEYHRHFVTNIAFVDEQHVCIIWPRRVHLNCCLQIPASI